MINKDQLIQQGGSNLNLKNQGVEFVLAMVKGLCASVTSGETSQEALDTAIVGAYHDATAEYMPLIKALPSVIGVVGEDLTPVIIGFKKAANKIRSNEEYREVIRESNRLTAQMRMEYIETYKAAGFSRQEAMNLLLQDNAMMKTAMANIKPPASIPNLKSKK